MDYTADRQHTRAILLHQAEMARIRSLYHPTEAQRKRELAEAERMERDAQSSFFADLLDSKPN